MCASIVTACSAVRICSLVAPLALNVAWPTAAEPSMLMVFKSLDAIDPAVIHVMV